MSRRTYWTAAITFPDQERRAAFHAEQQGFDYYLPETRQLNKSGEFSLRRLLFPKYIFILVKRAACWKLLLRLPGIRRLFMHRDQPVPVPNKDIETLKSMEDDSGSIPIRSNQPQRRIRAGMKAKVKDGFSMAGLTCEVVMLKNHDRCEVLFEFLGREVRAMLHERALDVVV